MNRLRLPPPGARPVLAVAAALWAGVLLGRSWGWVPALVGAVPTVLAGLSRRRSAAIVAAAAVAGVVAGAAGAATLRAVFAAGVPEGPAGVIVRATTDDHQGRFGSSWFLARPQAWRSADGWLEWQGPPVLVDLEKREDVSVGDTLLLEGESRARPGRAAGDPYAGTIEVRRLQRMDTADQPLLMVGNAIRRRVLERLSGRSDSAAALLAGFLVGETEDLDAVDLQALRRAGLSHYVAVSGSNVALFLAGWWLVLGPLAARPRRRAAAGLVGIVVFAVVTRWEASVLRASAMAGTVLAGRLISISLDPWAALGVGVSGALLFSASLATDVGFMLSVAATAGVLASAVSLRGILPPKVAELVGATLGAQVAVLPITLTVFGSVPLASPVTNLVAAPLVAAATAVGSIGTLAGMTPLVAVGTWLSGLVLRLARLASAWPQLGALEVVAASGLAGLVVVRRLRPLAVVVAAGAVAASLLGVPAGELRPAVVVLDVGQGDAVLVLGASGLNMLVDGGPDPVVLADHLARFGIARLDLVVSTHPHADHNDGLLGAIGRLPVGRLWHANEPHSTESWERVEAAAGEAGVPVEAPPVGEVLNWGDLTIQVLGPLRKYAGPNDQSIVLLVDAGAGSVLLTGDAETFAQADLGPVRADILKVPHQGGATSDLAWLVEAAVRGAVISVGPNDYGHPSPEVVSALSGDVPLARTDRDGTVVIPLIGDPLARFPQEAFRADLAG